MTESGRSRSTSDIDPDRTVDNRGRGCANGIARVQRALEDLPDGGILEIKSTDNRAKEEYPQLAAQTSHELIDIETNRTGLFRKEYITYLRIHQS